MEQTTPPRKVYLPLNKLGKCAGCETSSAKKYCSACGEVAYCSADCQKDHWSTHRNDCGKTDRLDLASFYPFIACLVEENRLSTARETHPALTHQIINSPNPNQPAWPLPDGAWARVVALGDPVPPTSGNSELWWPSAQSHAVRSKLWLRIMREGNVLPILTAVCVALLAEVYTTTSGTSTGETKAQQERRVRLRYNSSPIADFGICAGSAEVTSQDTLAYMSDTPNTPIIHGQDPKDHYWLYFRTTAGEVVTLDCSMFTFNMCTLVQTAPYAPNYGSDLHTVSQFAPAWFRDREQDKFATNLYKERKRVSVLRDPDLHKLIARTADDPLTKSDTHLLAVFMAKISGRTYAADVRDQVLEYTRSSIMHDIARCRGLLDRRGYLRFPAAPELAIQGDPDELRTLDNEIPDDWLVKARKLRAKEKKGLLTHEQVNARMRKLNDSLRS